MALTIIPPRLEGQRPIADPVGRHQRQQICGAHLDRHRLAEPGQRRGLIAHRPHRSVRMRLGDPAGPEVAARTGRALPGLAGLAVQPMHEHDVAIACLVGVADALEGGHIMLRGLSNASLTSVRPIGEVHYCPWGCPESRRRLDEIVLGQITARLRSAAPRDFESAFDPPPNPL
jgi:hypothetical protein